MFIWSNAYIISADLIWYKNQNIIKQTEDNTNQNAYNKIYIQQAYTVLT